MVSIEILYEDNHLIAVNKPNGLLVQGDESGDTTLLDLIKDYIKETYNKPGKVYAGLVHRIDRPVSGVVLFAKTSKALSRLNEQLRNKEIERIYWAIVKNKPPKLEDTIVHYLRKDQEKNKSFAGEKPKKSAKRAELSYQVIGKSDKYFLLSVKLNTGRHHQIRCQLANIGCPIRGDLKYGFPRSNDEGGIHLHAKLLKFTHPVKKTEVTIEAPLPKDPMWGKFNQLSNE